MALENVIKKGDEIISRMVVAQKNLKETVAFKTLEDIEKEYQEFVKNDLGGMDLNAAKSLQVLLSHDRS